MVIVNVTPEIALDRSKTYAGGLGVLEGDKFYAAGDMGLEYVVFSLFYRHGYVKVKTSEYGISFEPEEQSRDFYSELRAEEDIVVTLRNTLVYVKPWIYEYKTAKAILFEAVCPDWARELTNRVYVEDTEDEKYLKYILLAKSTAEYLKNRIGLDKVSIIDLEESYTAPLLFQLQGFESKSRMIIHTPGPWGHPVFPSSILENEFKVKYNIPMVNMTSDFIGKTSEVIVVSRKQGDIIPKVFPNITRKIRAVTNGIYLERWMDRELFKWWISGDIDIEKLRNTRIRAKRELESLLRQYKDVEVGEKIVITWARRLSRYKRPYFIAEFIETNPDLDAIYVLAGKPHPRDPDGLKYLTWFRDLDLRLRNVIYIPDYDLDIAKILVKSSDVWVFTPFSGWEACGTSYMKALVNGIPVLSSRDGGVVEIVEDGFNGWLFGEDIRDFINIYEDPRALEIDRREFREFSGKLIKVIEKYNSDPGEYWRIALNAWRETPRRVDIKNMLREYYLKNTIIR